MNHRGLGWIAESVAVSRSRRELALLDDRALADLGLTLADVAAECARPFWDRQVYNRHDHRRRFADRPRQMAWQAEGGKLC